jgi:hypothetical protein
MRETQRKAYICTHKDCQPTMRVFLLPGDEEPPRCPAGHGKMKQQVNMAYMRARNGRPAK